MKGACFKGRRLGRGYWNSPHGIKDKRGSWNCPAGSSIVIQISVLFCVSHRCKRWLSLQRVGKGQECLGRETSKSVQDDGPRGVQYNPAGLARGGMRVDGGGGWLERRQIGITGTTTDVTNVQPSTKESPVPEVPANNRHQSKSPLFAAKKKFHYELWNWYL